MTLDELFTEYQALIKADCRAEAAELVWALDESTRNRLRERVRAARGVVLAAFYPELLEQIKSRFIA